ncbi:TetR/AcrR family transcriptional regulator [Rhizobium sp. AAP43]|uniref:TetR/AcrR family transcriptional regulator n=1 Tax=Rhizobium sp. AAP43 TaxID=1523420 RepID=UPI0006B9BF59|nr:TetR/AcrR family transcriptional regulator [Rhizobium sp. AAP43]KPF43662.1 TetR family transcriptional regulator [Rhizobium sp. AAP43]
MSDKVDKGRLQQRKKPMQERSIQRLESILEAAVGLFLEKGVNNVTMSEIAQRAHIPIGSLYQFFPQKAAIIKALHDRLSSEMDGFILNIFADTHTLDEAAERAAKCLLEIFDIIRKAPIHISLWQAILADNDLNQLSAEFHERLITAFYKDLAHLVPEGQCERFRINLKLMIMTTSEVIRFSSHQSEEAASAYLARWRQIIRSQIFNFDP